MLLSALALLSVALMACEGGRGVPTPPLDTTLSAHFALIEEGQSGPARVRIRRYMEAEGWTARPLFLMGLSYHSERRYAKAAEWFEQSIAAADIYPPAHHFLGWARYYLGQPQGAAEAFRGHLLTTPGEGDSHFGLGLVAIEAGDLVEAERRFNAAINLQGGDDRSSGRAKAMARLADVMAARGRWAEAERLLRRGLELDGDLYEAWYRQATALRRLGRDAEADDAMDQFVATRQRLRPDLGFPE